MNISVSITKCKNIGKKGKFLRQKQTKKVNMLKTGFKFQRLTQSLNKAAYDVFVRGQ